MTAGRRTGGRAGPLARTGALLLAGLLAHWALAGAAEAAFSFFKARERSLADDYTLLNRLLVQRVQTNSPVENIQAAVGLLRGSTQGQRDDLGVELPGQRALVQFTELINLLDPEEPHCDMVAHNILVENGRATKADLFRPSDDQPALRRIEMVIYQVASQHAAQCFAEYPHKFIAAAVAKPKRAMRDVRDMMDAMIRTSGTKVLELPNSRPMDARQKAAYKSAGVDVAGKAETAALLGHLRLKSSDEPDTRCYLRVMSHPVARNRWVVYEDQVVVLLERFVYAPCEFLFNSFEHVLLPAEFEQKLYKKSQRYRATNEAAAEFMIWLEYYRLCKDLTAKKEQVEDGVIQRIWDELY